ncbi:MAG: hypothetical protein GWN73_26055, partial [Actinobacteria bacterium]|nr:hypothetical protein [Actinomycetota bacterium]NIU68685.1 hypothetical protein [Actinomycetota bacterium]NIW30529.1 hypothetical protein [Actinomycetota bacterium]
MDSTISDATPDAVVDAAPDAGADAGPPMATNVYRFGAAENDIISDVAVASDGTVFASGSVRSGTITIGTFTLPSAGPGSNVVVFARATDGSIRWARRFPGTSLFDTGTRPSTALALAADGTLWLASTFSGDADFGDGVMRSASWRACYVLTLDPTTGDPTVESVLGGAQLCEPHDIGLRTGGGFVIGGMFNGPLDLGGGALVTGSMPGQFVAAFDGDGSHVWSRAFADATIGRTSFDDAGNVYVCGGARDTTDIGDGTHDVAGSYAPFVSSFDGSGTNRWATVFPASEGSCYSVSTSPAGRSALVLLPSGSSRRIVIGATTYGAGETVLLGITAAGADDWAQPLPRTPWAYGDRGPGETLLLTGFVEADEDFGGGTRMAIGGGFDA